MLTDRQLREAILDDLMETPGDDNMVAGSIHADRKRVREMMRILADEGLIEKFRFPRSTGRGWQPQHLYTLTRTRKAA